MTKPTHLLFAVTAASLLAASATGQRLATYDPGRPLEFATSSCSTAPSYQSRQNLATRTPAPLPRAVKMGMLFRSSSLAVSPGCFCVACGASSSEADAVMLPGYSPGRSSPCSPV